MCVCMCMCRVHVCVSTCREKVKGSAYSLQEKWTSIMVDIMVTNEADTESQKDEATSAKFHSWSLAEHSHPQVS